MAFGGTAAKLEVLLMARDEATKKIMGLTKTVEESAARMKQIGLAMMAIGIVGVGAMTMFAKKAAAAVESENLFTISLDKNAAAARKWSEDLRKSVGLNSYEVRKQVGVFTVMLKSMGLGEDKAYGMAKGMVQLAYDMASFYNLRPEEAFEKISSGIVGMPRPLQDLGIVINEEVTKLYAYKAGIAAVGTALTLDQKILARYGALMERTALAQGDLARTIKSPENALRVLSARIGQLVTDLGVELLPTFLRVIRILDSAAKWFDNLNPQIKKIIANTALFGSGLLVVAGAGLVFKAMLMGLAVFKWAVIISAFETFALKLMYMVDGLKAFSLAAARAIGWAAAIYAVIEAEVRLINAGTAGIFKLMETYEKLRGRGKGPAAQDYGEQAKKYWEMAVSPKSQAWESIFKPMVDSFVNGISTMAEAAKLPGQNLQKSLQDAGDEAEKQFGAGAALGKSAFGAGEYIPALMAVSGGFMGTVKSGLNVLNFTIYASDDKVGQAVQAALNKSIN